MSRPSSEASRWRLLFATWEASSTVETRDVTGVATAIAEVLSAPGATGTDRYLVWRRGMLQPGEALLAAMEEFLPVRPDHVVSPPEAIRWLGTLDLPSAGRDARSEGDDVSPGMRTGVLVPTQPTMSAWSCGGPGGRCVSTLRQHPLGVSTPW